MIIGGVSGDLGISGELLDSNNLPAPLNSIHFDDKFIFQGTLAAGTYYLKVTGKDDAETGRYTVRAIREGTYTYFENRCSNISRNSGINDPLYGCQWHLNNDEQFLNSAGQDIRVEEVWPTYTGDGINVVIVDDGMQVNHEDLKDNVDTSQNHNYDPGQTDIYDYFEWHGTAVAGLIAAKDNGLGVRGVAPDATIYGYNFLAEQSDANEADAMSRNATTTAISNNSWGSRDYGRPQHVSELWEIAVRHGVTNGYDGKGVFYVFSGGNGNEHDDYSILDEQNNFYAVTAVCAVGHDDKRSTYSESGPNLWICGPSSSGRVGQPGITTTDTGHRYWGRFGGTSAAAPIVSGVAALIREANNSLTWRDVKLILAASARMNDADNTGWEQGALQYGSTTEHYNFNHEYGFGMVDAKAAVDLAAGWTNAPEFREITSESAFINLAIPDSPSSGTPTTVSTSLNLGPYVEFIEFVEINTNFNHGSFRDLSVELVSPSGAVSTLVPSAPIDAVLTSKFRFGSARHMGEDAAGEWTLRMKDEYRGDSGTLRSWSLTVYGHGYKPGAPEIGTVTPGGGTLIVEWDAPIDTGSTAITSYDLRYIRDDVTDRSDDNWGLEEGVGTLTNRSHTISGLEGGIKYEFQLRAHNSSGHGPWSRAAADEPTTVAPSAPSISSVTRGDRTLAVVWAEPSDTGGATITAYDVRYINTSADETVDANWTARDNAWRSGDLQYVVRNLTNATQYDVQVRAVNRAGDGEWSETETGTPLPDDIPITLQWEDTTLDVQEDAGSVVLTAIFTTTLNAPPEADFTFDVALTTTDLGATQNDDYTPPPSSATFVAGDFSQMEVNGEQRYRATRDFDVVILDDTEDESDEDLSVTLAYQTPGLPHLTGGPASATVTIRDNDHVPVSIGWQQAVLSVNEGAQTVTLSVIATTTKDKIPDEGFSMGVSVSTSDGDATQPDDYTQLFETVTFDRGDFSRARVDGQWTYRAVNRVEVTVVDDTVDEPDEIFDLTARYLTPVLPHLLGGPASAAVTITDDDHVPVTIEWEQAAFNVDEGAGTFVLRAIAATMKDKMPESGFSFDASVSTTDGTASQNEDYQRLSTTLRFRRGDFDRQLVNGQYVYIAGKDVNVRIVEDTDDEPTEDFNVSLEYANTEPHLQGGSDTATIAINDNDHVPVVLGWEQTSLTADEVTGADDLRAVAVTTKDKMPESGFTFDARATTRNGTAREPADYTPLDETVTFDHSDFRVTFVNGQRRYRAVKSFTVTVADDGTAEQSEQFSVLLAYVNPGLPHLLSGELTATVTVVDDLSSTVDLFLSARASQARLSRGDELSYSYSVSNSGPATSTGTVLQVTLEPGVAFVSATPAGTCSKSGSRLVRCEIDSMRQSASESGEITLRVEPSAAEDITITSEVTSDEVDSMPAGNSVSELIELDAAPEQVKALKANGGSSYIELSWRRPSDNGSSITRYELQRKEEGEDYADFSPAPSTSATSYRDNQVTTDKTYTYQLRAVNEDGEAEWSNEASATVGVKPPPPPPPEPKNTGGGGGGGFIIVPVNADPEFSEDSRTARTIEENAPQGAEVGEPVKASDEDGDDLTYSLKGVDAEFFAIDQESGQIEVLAELDHETRDTYLLRLSVSDGNDGDDSIKVDVTVTDVDEPPEITGETMTEYPEGPEGKVAEFAAADPERASVIWGLAGDDAGVFKFEDGVLSFATTTDYEAPGDADADSVYTLTVEASDGDNAATLEVAVTVTDVDEPPVLSGPASLDYRESEGNVVASYTAADPEGEEVTWAVAGEDRDAFVIEGGVLSFAVPPNFEAPVDSDADNVYRLVVQAMDGNDNTGRLEVEVSVLNVEDEDVVSRYDSDGDKLLDRSEALVAVFDYFANLITKEEAIEAVSFYFAN